MVEIRRISDPAFNYGGNEIVKISVIIPVYNCEKYISACLDSVLNQTWKNLEIILIDDGSEDNSGEICEQYALYDERIRVIHQENHGVSHARNVGLKIATGNLVSFIDSDDTLELEMYELLLRVMQENAADISHCGYKHIVGDEVRLVHDTKRIIKQNTVEALECFVSGRMFGGGLWNKLFRRELIDDLLFDEKLKINEDVLFNFEAFSRAKISVFADYAMYNYIAHFGTSAVFRTSDEKKIKDSCEVAKKMYEALCNSELRNIAADRYIRNLSGYYKYCLKSKVQECKKLSKEMQNVASKTDSLGRNMKITVMLIKYCPWLYSIVNAVYTKIRKPQWEARKD